MAWKIGGVVGSWSGRRGFVLASGAALLVRGAAAQPAATGLIRRSLMFAPPDHRRAAISPDGTRVAFLAPVDGVMNVWVAPVAEPAAARPLTRVTDRDVLDRLCWPQDNRHIVFFRDRGGDENWQAHAVDIETGEVRILSPGPGVKAFVRQVSARFPGELLIGHNQRDKAYFDIYRVNAATGDSALLFRNDSLAEVFTDSHFRVPFGVRYRDNGDWDVVKATGAGAGSVFRTIAIEDRYTTALIGASDDGKQLYWLDSQGRDSAAVLAQDLADGRMRILLQNRSADFCEPLFDPVRGTPVAASLIYTRRRWYTIDPAAAADLDRLQASIDGDIVGFEMSNDRAVWTVYAEPVSKPGRYYLYQRKERRAVPLFSTRAGLDDVHLVRREPVVIPTRGNLRLVGYLSRAGGGELGQAGPMVLLVHDGPWTRDYPEFSVVHQWLANRGYNVLSVNFRGSTGLGKKTANAGDGEWGDKMQNDLLDAIEWAINERVADESRIAICGAGYGGYAALMGAVLAPGRFACAVDFAGITDLVAYTDVLRPSWKASASGMRVRLGANGTTENGRKFLASRSPLSFIDRLQCPLLIGHGANDTRVPISQSDAFVAALQQRKLPVTYVVYGDEGHIFGRVANRRSFAAVTEVFLAQNLGGRAEPVGEDLAGSSLEFRAGRGLIKGLG